jgi:hypothetical protein
MILRPYRYIKLQTTLIGTLTKTIELLRKNLALTEQIVDGHKKLIALRDQQIASKDQEITRLKADLKLLDAHLVNTVDQVHRDGIEPPESKKYLN